MTEDEMKAEIARLNAENEKLKQEDPIAHDESR